MDELVDIHAHLLVIDYSRTDIELAMFANLSGIVTLVDAGHGSLVDVEEDIYILLRVDCILLSVCLGKCIEVLLRDLIIGILLVDILVVVLPCEWHSLHAAADTLTTLLGFAELRIDIGLRIVQITMHGHHDRIDRSDTHVLVHEHRHGLRVGIHKNTAVLLRFLQCCDEYLTLSLSNSLLRKVFFFFCHIIKSFMVKNVIGIVGSAVFRVLSFLIQVLLGNESCQTHRSLSN